MLTELEDLTFVRMSHGAELLPPYASYSSWVKLLDSLAGSLPGGLDESYLVGLGFSESSIKPLRSALRFLRLVGRDDRPTDRLERLVEAIRNGGTEKAEALKEMIYQSYEYLFSSEFDLRSATTDQLRVYFGSMGARGQIQQKCSSFFLNLARDAGLDLPPQLVSRAPLALGRQRSSMAGSRNGDSATSDANGLHRQTTFTSSRDLGLIRDVFPTFDIDWPEDKKQRWFKDFARLMRICEKNGNRWAS